MPNALETLRNIIDEQDVDELQLFITDNQALDYDNICSNGASALWWALMPPTGKRVNKAIVKLLLDHVKNDGNHLISPVQDLSGLTPRQYLQHNFHRSDFRDASDIVTEAERRYERPQRAAANGHDIARLAADGQNVHDSMVTALSRGNVISLHKHYVEEKSNPLDKACVETAGREIAELIDAIKKEQQEDDEQMLYGLTFCYNSTNSFDFKPSEENDKTFSLTLAQLITLNWIAAKEQDTALLPDGATDKQALESRKKSILNILYDIATAYGKNKASCVGGACNRLGMALASQHKLAKAYAEGEKITGEMAIFIILRILGEALGRLSTDDKDAYWAVIRYTALEFKKVSAEDNDRYDSFITANKGHLEAKMLAENIDEDCIKGAIKELNNDYPYNNHKASYQLIKLMGVMNQYGFDSALLDGNTPIDEAVDKAVEELAKNLALSTAKCNSGYKMNMN